MFENLKTDNPISEPQYQKFQDMGPVFINKARALGFNDVNLTKTILDLTKKETDSIITSNKAEVPIQILILRDYEQPFFKILKPFAKQIG